MDIRTDLAFESHNFCLKKNNKKDFPGIRVETINNDIYKITRVFVESKEASREIGKPIGKYITIHSEHVKTGLYTKELSIILSRELSTLIPKEKKNPVAFVAGLGNTSVTPDSVGPEVVSSLIITRHIANKLCDEHPLSSLCALSPGVLGVTGIETAEIFSSVASHVKPDYFIAIDALASRSPENVGTTIQISDTGINPGSGVNNRRNALTEKTLGVPVIVLGVPTVTDAKSIVYDSLNEIFTTSNLENQNVMSENIISNILKTYFDDLMVTPKNIDAIVTRASVILSRAINLAVHKGFSYKEIIDYTS